MDRIDRDALVRMTPAQRAKVLLSTKESQWYGRKSIRVDVKKLAAAIIGMANAEGGCIAVGISEGRLENIADDLSRLNRLRRIPIELIEPPLRVSIDELEAEADGLDRDIMLIWVEPSRHAHQRTDGESFLRAGDSTITLNRAAWQELFYDREADSYEAHESPVQGQEVLDQTVVERLRSAIGAEGDDRHVLRARSLLTPEGKLSIAGMLLCGRHPEEVFPQALVRVVRYQADEPGTGSRQMMAADGDERIDGSIPAVLDRVIALVEQWAPRRRALKADGRFGSVDVIPKEAWLETIVNAVVHRSYSMAGDHIRVLIFPHRIEVSSPGRFPGLVDVTRPLQIPRYARNPRIARVCSDLGYAQELGEGIRRMVAEMRRSGLSDPVYQQTATSVIVRLDAGIGVDSDIIERVGADALDIVTLLRTEGPLGTGAIADALGVARPTVLRRLRALADEEVVERTGHSARDPRATWRIVGA